MADLRLILDTDIGTDVDDALALALALLSPEVRLEAVTVVYGDVDLRARMVLKLLRLAGRSDIPVARGIGQPLLRNRPVYWAGHEGQGLLTGEDHDLPLPEGHAVDLIIERVMANPGEITLVPIGPLTNIAAAIIREPRIVSRLRRVVLMGGVLRTGPRFDLPLAEHNIRSDPEAASVVFSAGLPLTMVGLDVTTQVRITRSDCARINAVGTPFHQAIADQVLRYLHLRRRDWTYLHDPLALATAIDPTFVATRALRIRVETRGDLTTGMTLAELPTDEAPATAEAAIAVDSDRFHRFFLERLLRPLPPRD